MKNVERGHRNFKENKMFWKEVNDFGKDKIQIENKNVEQIRGEKYIIE